MEEKILIEAKNLKKYFKVGASSQLHAVDGVNFKIKRGTIEMPMARQTLPRP